MGKIYAKTEVSKPSQKPLDYAKQSAADALKPLQKEQFRKQQKKLETKLLIK